MCVGLFWDGDDVEFMWVKVESIEGELIKGRLDSDPHTVSTIAEGDLADVEIEDLNDWVYIADGEMIGGFPIKVLQGVQADAVDAD